MKCRECNEPLLEDQGHVVGGFFPNDQIVLCDDCFAREREDKVPRSALPPRLESIDLMVACLCGQASVRVTMASQLYQDARCPVCHRSYRAEITLRVSDGTEHVRA